ncbi:MAG: SDR family oxidoreductase [Lachnospiraceae bacterium]|nr:SDR family oxidoreductase [Lachnospiraceae bacterium]
MKILLLGSNGMLGQSIRRQFTAEGVGLYGVDRVHAEYCFDLLDDDRLEQCMREVKPDIVINTAAIVSLDMCENAPGSAYQLNARLPGVLANLCRCLDCYLVHISTDQYYSGDGDSVHSETAPLQLVNEYARTKYAGEQMALTYKDCLVLRTNIVGFRGSGQKTFVEWAVSEIENQKTMTLFSDFYTSSIHTMDFSRILSDMLRQHPTGIYNLASSEVSSKKDLILGLSREIFGKEPSYESGSVQNIKGTPRGNSLGLDTGKIEKLLGYRMPDRKETLNSIKKEYFERRKRDEV